MGQIMVLLSTYNGERYLREQLDSVLAQKEADVRILVRDDGSCDDTVPILEEYRKKGALEYFSGAHLGAAGSFLELLSCAPESPGYALCDQDDIWMPEKLKTAAAGLAGRKGPALFYHGVTLTDMEGRETGYYFREQSKAQNLAYSALFGDEIPGCTMVLNRALAEAVNAYRPGYVTIHDAWIHRVCLCVGGTVIGEEKPFLYYRQHDRNTIGMKKRTLQEQLAQFMRRERKFSRLAGEMLKGYAAYLSEKDRELLERLSDCYVGWKNKGVVLRQGLYSRASVEEKMKLAAKVLYGTL